MTADPSTNFKADSSSPLPPRTVTRRKFSRVSRPMQTDWDGGSSGLKQENRLESKGMIYFAYSLSEIEEVISCLKTRWIRPGICDVI